MFCPFLENREEEKNDQQTGSKNQRNKGTDRGGTGPDVKLHSGARAEKKHLLNSERHWKGRQKQSGSLTKRLWTRHMI